MSEAPLKIFSIQANSEGLTPVFVSYLNKTRVHRNHHKKTHLLFIPIKLVQLTVTYTPPDNHSFTSLQNTFGSLSHSRCSLEQQCMSTLNRENISKTWAFNHRLILCSAQMTKTTPKLTHLEAHLILWNSYKLKTLATMLVHVL